MANRSWGRTGVAYGAGYGAMQAGMGYFVGAAPQDKRAYANNVGRYQGGAGGAAGYRTDYYKRTDRRDDFRGAKRPAKGRSPVGDRRSQHDSFSGKKDNRPFGKRPFAANYEVRLPKHVFGAKSLCLTELRQRHLKLNIPSDFFDSSNLWTDSFPIYQPLKLGDLCDFHVFHRDVENPHPADPSYLEPADADYSYSVRVMLIGCPPPPELCKLCCRSADDSSNTEKIPISKNIYFLIGGRAKNETSSIGGPWSPSLDGPDPATNQQTLVNCAIRIFKGFTGIDLSSCTQWTKFLEVKYYRNLQNKAPAYTTEADDREITHEKPEVVAFLVPNISHLMPSEEEWQTIKEHYSNVLQNLLNPLETPVDLDQAESGKDQESQNAENSIDESDEPIEKPSGEPTHYSKLDVSSLKVSDLRNELALRNIDSKGLKAQLQSRLQTALDDEKAKENAGGDKTDDDTRAEQTPTKTATPAAGSTHQEKEKDDSKQLSEKDRRRLERLYRLGDRPSILVHPNKAARGGRFDCHRVSLHTLLDYRTDEMKEPNFEVALFAEQFHEMMQRDCAFNIFKAIYNAPEKEHKTEQNGKLNGLPEDLDEPESKRQRSNSQGHDNEEATKARKLRRTLHPDLLLSFTYFDSGYAGYIREHDLCDLLHLLGLNFSRAQMKHLVSRVIGRRDSVQYRLLTDGDVIEGDENDVVSLGPKLTDDQELAKRLSLGNSSFFGGKPAPGPTCVYIGCQNGDASLLRRVEAAENTKKKFEYQFFQIKDELERTRVRLNGCKDIEDKLEAENSKLSSQLKDEQKQTYELRHLYNAYNHLVRVSRDHMERALSEINKQFEKERAKREAERAAVEAEKAKSECRDESGEPVSSNETEAKAESEPKVEEKDWEVVDTV